MKTTEKQKMSKKAQKELNASRRNLWETNPVTKVVKDKKKENAKNACRAKICM